MKVKAATPWMRATGWRSRSLSRTQMSMRMQSELVIAEPVLEVSRFAVSRKIENVCERVVQLTRRHSEHFLDLRNCFVGEREKRRAGRHLRRHLRLSLAPQSFRQLRKSWMPYYPTTSFAFEHLRAWSVA